MKINLRSVDLNLLTVFDSVMREGKLSAAAETLGMTQPAVSNAISRLRLTFDDELFIRTRHGVVPTPRAQQLAMPIADALQSIRDVLDPGGQFDPATSERVFKLAIGDYGELMLLPALINVFNQYNGKLSIETYQELDEASLTLVKQGLIDFYFDFSPPKDNQLDHCFIGQEDVVVIARKDHPHYKKQISKKDYLDADHILLNYEHKELSLLDVLMHNKQRINRKVKAKVRQYVAIPGLIVESDCIATVPFGMAEYFIQRFPLSIFPLPFKLDPVSTYMIWHKALNRDAAHQWLKDRSIELADSR